MADSSSNAEKYYKVDYNNTYALPFYSISGVTSKYSADRALANICIHGSFAEIDRFLRSSNVSLDRPLNVGSFPVEWTCLMYAARYINQGVISYLLQKKVDLHYIASDGFTPLMAIAMCSSPSDEEDSFNCAQAIINAGAKISYIPRFDGWTLLTMAVINGSTKLVKLLISSGARVNERDDLGRTPFIVAVAGNTQEIVEMLFKAGANPYQSNLDGDNCETIAYQLKNIEMERCVVVLLERYYKEEYQGNQEKLDRMRRQVNRHCKPSEMEIVYCIETGGLKQVGETRIVVSLSAEMIPEQTIARNTLLIAPGPTSQSVNRSRNSRILGGLVMIAAATLITRFFIRNFKRA